MMRSQHGALEQLREIRKRLDALRHELIKCGDGAKNIYDTDLAESKLKFDKCERI